MDIVPAFVDETGVLTSSPKAQPVYGIGVLVVHDPALLTDSFYKLHFSFLSKRATQRKQLRREIREENRKLSLDEVDHLMWSSRHHEYKFNDVTSHNIQQYIDLLNLYFSFECVEFHALLLDRLDSGFNLKQWNNDSWQAYVELCAELLERSLKTPVFAIVDLQGQPNASTTRLEDVVCAVKNVSGCLRSTSDTSVFLQIVDVLLGCVQFDWKEANGFYDPKSKRAESKRELTNFVKTRIGSPINEPILTKEANCWETTKPSLFTAWLKNESAAMSGVHPD